MIDPVATNLFQRSRTTDRPPPAGLPTEVTNVTSRSRIAILLLALSAAGAAGCKPTPSFTFTPVEGTVRKDGKPLEEVLVIFFPDPETPGPRSISEITDAAGHFRLHTDDGVDGAVIGKHRVCIYDPRESGAALNRRRRDFLARKAKGDSSVAVAERLEAIKALETSATRVPATYGRMEETPLRIEVGPGTPVIELEVK